MRYGLEISLCLTTRVLLYSKHYRALFRARDRSNFLEEFNKQEAFTSLIAMTPKMSKFMISNNLPTFATTAPPPPLIYKSWFSYSPQRSTTIWYCLL